MRSQKKTNQGKGQARTGKILQELKDAYPEARTALRFRNPLEILVATILSAQCTDARVNIVTPVLFKKYRCAKDYAHAEQQELEKTIRSTGFYRNKAKNIIGACRKIIKDFGGTVPNTMTELLTLPGVARKTANIVLSSGYGIIEGIAVDTHVTRLSRRLGLSRYDDPEKIERDLIKLLPKKEWSRFSHLLINHGRKICHARKPECPACMLKAVCPSYELYIREA